MRLANGILALEFDEATGSLVQIEDLRAGLRHLADPSDGRLFRVVAPDEERWIGRYCESHQSGRPRMQAQAGRAVIHYPDLQTAEGQPAGIAATVTVSLPEGADEARLVIEVRNASPFLIHEVWFPCIGGWRGYAGPGQDRLTLGNCTDADPHSLRGARSGTGYTLCMNHRRRFHFLPIAAGFPMLDISGGGRGLSYIHYPTKVRTGGIVVEDMSESADQRRPAWSWVHMPFIPPGGSWTSDPVGIAPHSGDWHATADRMRAWLRTWWTPPPMPPRLRGAIGYQNVQFRDFEGRDLRPPSDLPALARHGLEHGIEHFCLWDMIMAVYLRAGRGGLFEDRPERIADLKRALKETRALGVQVSTLINLRLITQKSSLWPQWGEARALRSLYGARAVESWPCRRDHAAFFTRYLEEGGFVLCQCNPDFQRWALSRIEEALDLGFTSLFIDQPFEQNVCFSPDHGHGVPAHGHEGACAWIPEAARRVRERDPEGYVIGENADMWTSRFLQLWWNWGWDGLRSEVFRYTLPDSLQSWIIDACEHEHQVGKAFAMGFLLSLNVCGLEKTLTDVPEFAERVRHLAALRRRTEDFTVCGRFLDRQGLRWDSDAELTACLYDAGAKLGVIVSDMGSGRAGAGLARLHLDLAALGRRAPAAVRLHRLDGSTETPATTQSADALEVELRLAHRESCVLEVA